MYLADTLAGAACSYRGMRGPLALVLLLILLAATPAGAAPPPAHFARGVTAASLRGTLGAAMAAAGPYSGAYVVDARNGGVLFSSRADTPRSLASNTKLFTTSAVLSRDGPAASRATIALGVGSLDASGTYKADLYLRGGGDPSFGSRPFASRNYGTDSDVEALAAMLRADGLRAVSGSIVGDESLFDALRGGPDESLTDMGGLLSALSYDRGLANADGSAFQLNPPLFAAARLTDALRRVGIRVHGAPRVAPSPARAVEVAEVRSPSVARLVRLTNKDSDNFFAEMLAKGLSIDVLPGGPLRMPSDPVPRPPVAGGAAAGAAVGPAPPAATMLGGARAVATAARVQGARVTLVDGSGLSRRDRATPRQVAKLLLGLRARPYFGALFDSLPIAGVDGTLRHRMRSGPARGRCRAKTGTLIGVSALSGYCATTRGRTIVFSILMSGLGDVTAHTLEDRMAQAIAAY